MDGFEDLEIKRLVCTAGAFYFVCGELVYPFKEDCGGLGKNTVFSLVESARLECVDKKDSCFCEGFFAALLGKPEESHYKSFGMGFAAGNHVLENPEKFKGFYNYIKYQNGVDDKLISLAGKRVESRVAVQSLSGVICSSANAAV